MTARRWSELVYATVRLIPRGRVATYGQIATLLGRPRGAREVGWALRGCSDARVPCHRVVDRNGRLAPRFTAQGARLRAEAVPFLRGRVVVAEVVWRPTGHSLRAIGRSADAVG
ncbi:MAG: MGMT family protein [Candidatus Limnocylindria bacterium]|nr:MGMT family protein [Chloroflexota bacterium]MDQ3399387.1 MGMT family protein [Chloroflexota bacterium]